MSRLLLALVVLLAAPAARAADAITIWWAQWAPADGLAELSRDFTQQTGIEVRVVQIPWGTYQDKVFLEFGNKATAFDIVIGDSQWIGRGATKGLYLDLTGWLPGAVDLKTIHPAALRYLCEYPAGSGKYFAAPCETDAVGFAYRTDWFADPREREAFQAKHGRELAPPATWQELQQIAAFFHRPAEKRYGCALLTGRGYDSLVMGWQNLLWAFGGSWGDPATFAVDGHVNSPGAVQALDFMKGLLASAPPGAANFDYTQCLESFSNGSVAMTMDYFAFFPGLAKSMGDRVGFFPVPAHDGRRVASLGGQGFSISTKVAPAQQELAKRFIAWFCTTEVQRRWITKDAGFTANLTILRSPEFRAAAPYNGPLADSIDVMQDFWNAPVYNELLATAQRCLGEALDGVKSSKAALDALAEEHAGILAEAGLAK